MEVSSPVLYPYAYGVLVTVLSKGVEEDFIVWWNELKIRLLPVLNGSSPISSLDSVSSQEHLEETVSDAYHFGCYDTILPTGVVGVQ